MLVAVIVGLTWVILTWAATYWAASRWGTTVLLQEDPLTGRPMPIPAAVLVQRAVRAVVGMAAGGVGGFALAMVFRSSLAALGVVAGYALVGEAVLRGVWRNIEPQLLSSRVAAFLDGQFVITRFPQSCGSGTGEPEIIRISALQGGVSLAVLLAARCCWCRWCRSSAGTSADDRPVRRSRIRHRSGAFHGTDSLAG